MYIPWGAPEWPARRVTRWSVADAGYVNFQLECGHVSWVVPKGAVAVIDACTATAAWLNGQRSMEAGCGACAAALPVTINPAAPLPLPLPAGWEAIHGGVPDLEGTFK